MTKYYVIEIQEDHLLKDGLKVHRMLVSNTNGCIEDVIEAVGATWILGRSVCYPDRIWYYEWLRIEVMVHLVAEVEPQYLEFAKRAMLEVAIDADDVRKAVKLMQEVDQDD